MNEIIKFYQRLPFEDKSFHNDVVRVELTMMVVLMVELPYSFCVVSIQMFDFRYPIRLYCLNHLMILCVDELFLIYLKLEKLDIINIECNKTINNILSKKF